MKISLNTIKFVNQHYGSAGDPAPHGLDDLVEKIGAQLGAIEEIIDVGSKYEGVVVVRIVSCEKHPNADKLNVCAIDDGGVTSDVERDENGHVQVVCGAPNVRAGLLVAWLPPGSTVPESVGKDPFVLGTRELRGVVSNGMLASARELALGDSHEGIMEIGLDSDETAPKPGTTFADAFHLRGDVVLDIENKMFTHRPDCFGFMGVAREIEGIYNRPYKSPAWYTLDAEIPDVEVGVLPLTVSNELPDLVPRFCAIIMRKVTVKPSPQWLQIDLAKVGQRSINNIVDYTNFFMLETGQPLHAYDYDKVKALSRQADGSAEIIIRHPRHGETIKLLNGKEVEPRAEAIMIAAGDRLIGVGGVMGGADTEVDETTKNIIIEVANFDMYSIRRTAMAHGLFTDAVTRFNKGQSPLQNRAVIAKIVDEIRKFADGKVASELIDDMHVPAEVVERGSVHPPVILTADFINTRLGSQLSADEMKTLLTNVEFDVAVDFLDHNDQSVQSLTVKAPFWRTDIEIPEDIVEEVGRLYGFDRLPLELPRRSIEAADRNELIELKQKVREVLSRSGANEVLTYSFVHGKLLEKAGQNPEQAFKLSNALSPDLQYYRLSLTPSLLDKVHPNIKAGHDKFALFEIGKGHNLMHADDDDGLPSEFEMLDLVYAAKDTKSITGDKTQAGAAFYQAKLQLETLANAFGLELAYAPIKDDMDYPVTKPYDLKRSAMVSIKATGDLPDQFLGMVGELRQEVLKNFKLPQQTAAFGIGLRELLAGSKQASLGYRPLPRFPKIEQDICLKVPMAMTYAELYDFVTATLESSKLENSYHSLSPVDIYQRPDDASHKQITLRLSIASYDKTLRDTEVSGLLDQVADAAQTSFGAERI